MCYLSLELNCSAVNVLYEPLYAHSWAFLSLVQNSGWNEEVHVLCAFLLCAWKLSMWKIIPVMYVLYYVMFSILNVQLSNWHLPGKQLIIHTFEWCWITILNVRKKFAGIVKNLLKKSVPKVSFYKIKYHLQELKQKWVSSKSLNIKNYQLQ